MKTEVIINFLETKSLSVKKKLNLIQNVYKSDTIF